MNKIITAFYVIGGLMCTGCASHTFPDAKSGKDFMAAEGGPSTKSRQGPAIVKLTELQCVKAHDKDGGKVSVEWVAINGNVIVGTTSQINNDWDEVYVVPWVLDYKPPFNRLPQPRPVGARLPAPDGNYFPATTGTITKGPLFITNEKPAEPVLFSESVPQNEGRLVVLHFREQDTMEHDFLGTVSFSLRGGVWRGHAEKETHLMSHSGNQWKFKFTGDGAEYHFTFEAL